MQHAEVGSSLRATAEAEVAAAKTGRASVAKIASLENVLNADAKDT